MPCGAEKVLAGRAAIAGFYGLLGLGATIAGLSEVAYVSVVGWQAGLAEGFSTVGVKVRTFIAAVGFVI